MDGAFDLLAAVQPSDGWFAVVGIKDNTPPVQRLVATREELDAYATRWVDAEYNVFFGVAKYATAASRKKDNVLALKSLWLDIDCGPGKADLNTVTNKPKGYHTQADGLAALRAFCTHTGMPMPIIVSSGRGLHVYWPLTEEVSREEWEPVAAQLYAKCVENDLYVDPTVFEVARILRVPGTYNFKGEAPLDVTVLRSGATSTLAELKAVLGVKAKPNGLFHDSSAPKREPSFLTKKMMDDRTKSFGKIMKLGEKGCLQLVSCYREREHLPEPRWFDALSIAHYCTDEDKAIRLLSEGHPGYSPEKVAIKVKHISGPHLCATFERNNPGGCAGCVHAGKIKSPIVLGIEIEKAPEEAAPTIPKFPFPFFRGKTGGVYRHGEKMDDGGSEPDELIYPYDFYVVKRMRDPQLGEVIIVRLHLPLDKVREFPIPNAKLTDVTELRKLLSAEGVVCHKGRFEQIMIYLIASATELQTQKKAEEMRTQFGWTDKNSTFVVGTTAITAEGKFYSPPSLTTAVIAEHMVPHGSYSEWKRVFALYGRPGLEPQAFAALTAFGSPLFKFSGLQGAAINIIHSRSGTGKTTALHMCNSVWGDPKRLCALNADTQNAKLMRLGIHNNLPVTYDEMTNIRAEDLSELIYCITQGRGKDRMKSSSNELRQNNSTWQTMALCSSNAAFYEKLNSFKYAADGENMRVIEYKLGFSDALSVDEGREAFDKTLLSNFGHAGPIYAEYLVGNLEHAQSIYAKVRGKLDNELGITQNERHWSAAVAANIAGGVIAKKLGILDWDIQKIWVWVTEMLVSMRSEVATANPMSAAPVEVIGQYLNTYFRNILIINANTGSIAAEFPIKEPIGELLVRIEPNVNRMYIAARKFQDYCVNKQINYRDTLSYLGLTRCYIGNESKRLGAGVRGWASAPVHCYVFDTSTTNFIEIEEPDDASGGD